MILQWEVLLGRLSCRIFGRQVVVVDRLPPPPVGPAYLRVSSCRRWILKCSSWQLCLKPNSRQSAALARWRRAQQVRWPHCASHNGRCISRALLSQDARRSALRSRQWYSYLSFVLLLPCFQLVCKVKSPADGRQGNMQCIS